MRERLLAVFGSLILVIIALYGIPRAYFLAGEVQRTEAQELERTANWVQALITESNNGGDLDDEYLERLVEDGQRIEYFDSEGSLLAVAGQTLGDHGEDLRVSRELPGGEELIVSRSGEAVQDRLVSTLMPIVMLGLGLSLLAGIVCVVMARRLSRPFRELADTARELGGGRFDLGEPNYRLPEAQAIGAALSKSAKQLKQLLDREREFAANASHQLRTPITALRLELEDLTYWPETSPEVATELTHALGELDRLSSAVTELLDLARGQRLGDAMTISVNDLLQASATRWSRQAKNAGRNITVRADPELTGLLHEGPVAQILDVLLENALTHGRGTVQLQAVDDGSQLQLSVTDNGARPGSSELFERRVSQGGGEGIGLAVASELAIAAGGVLRLDTTPTTRFVLVLPSNSAQKWSTEHPREDSHIPV